MAPGRRTAIGWRAVATSLAAVALVASCSNRRDDLATSSRPAPPGVAGPAASTTSPPSGIAPTPESIPYPAPRFDRALHDALVAMMQRDQGARGIGEASQETDEDRIAWLKQLIDEHGWPGLDLVGKDGEDAAWVIAQHADLDRDFQWQALALLRGAADAGQASPGNLAYLSDRVAVAADRPQTYGTQVGCTETGPEPATAIEDAPGLDERRGAAGLDPMAEYLAEMTATREQDD